MRRMLPLLLMFGCAAPELDGGEPPDGAVAAPDERAPDGAAAVPDPDAGAGGARPDGALPDAAAGADATPDTDAAPIAPDAGPTPDAAPLPPDAAPVPCTPSRQACDAAAPCCGDQMCGQTTLGQVCCGGAGAGCVTPNGEDCCGDLLCVAGRCQPSGGERPNFKAPYPCGQDWTYSHHNAEVRLALDFIRNDGGPTNGAPVLASATGVAFRRNEPGGAGQYIAMEHGDGWVTYYFHLSEYTAADGAWVTQGQQVGLTGSTGASSGPHIHYEQLLDGAGQTILVNGVSLAPYPGQYGQRSLVSDNGCDGEGRPYMTWGANRPVHAEPRLDAPVVQTLQGPTLVYVLCQVQGQSIDAEGFTNDWWSLLRDEGGYISNIYIDDPAAHLPGVPDCE